MTDDEDLSERADRLDETPALDDAISGSIVLINAIPVVGGVIGSFISEYVPRKKQARLVKFAQDLYREMEAESERIDREFIRTDEFEGLLEDVVDRVQTRKNEGKQQYWARLLAGSITTDRPPEGDRDRTIEALDGVRLSNLRLLHVIATTNEPPPGLYAGGISATLEWKLPGVPIDDLRRDWDELAALRLVHPYTGGTMTAQGAGNLVGRLTPFGREFVDRLRVDESVENDGED